MQLIDGILIVLETINISIANILELYYALLLGKEIYKMKLPQQSECLLSESEIDNKTELTDILSDQIGPIASKDHVIFYSNVPETSIMCADTSKQINSNNSVRYLNAIIPYAPSGKKLFILIIVSTIFIVVK